MEMDARMGAWPRGTAMPLGSLARIGLDLVAIPGGFWLAYLLRYQRQLGGPVAPGSYRPFHDFLPSVALLAAILVATFAARGLYRFAKGMDQHADIRQVIGCTLFAFLLLSAFVYYSQAFSYSRLVYLYAAVLVTAFLVLLELCRPQVASLSGTPGYRRAQLADIALASMIALLWLPLMLAIVARGWLQARRARDGQPPEGTPLFSSESIDE